MPVGSSNGTWVLMPSVAWGVLVGSRGGTVGGGGVVRLQASMLIKSRPVNKTRINQGRLRGAWLRRVELR